MASFKVKFPVLQELFAKNHRGGPLAPPPAGRGLTDFDALKSGFRVIFAVHLT